MLAIVSFSSSIILGTWLFSSCSSWPYVRKSWIWYWCSSRAGWLDNNHGSMLHCWCPFICHEDSRKILSWKVQYTCKEIVSSYLGIISKFHLKFKSVNLLLLPLKIELAVAKYLPEKRSTRQYVTSLFFLPNLLEIYKQNVR